MTITCDCPVAVKTPGNGGPVVPELVIDRVVWRTFPAQGGKDVQVAYVLANDGLYAYCRCGIGSASWILAYGNECDICETGLVFGPAVFDGLHARRLAFSPP